MEKLTFRPATRVDGREIATLHAENWRDIYRGILADAYLDGPIADERAALWESRLSSPDPDRRHVLLSEADGTLAGFACVFLDDEPLWGANFDNIHVSPRLRGQGLGRVLFKMAALWVISKEPSWPIHLWVFEANRGAVRFYNGLDGVIVERCRRKASVGAEVTAIRYVLGDLEVSCATALDVGEHEIEG